MRFPRLHSPPRGEENAAFFIGRGGETKQHYKAVFTAKLDAAGVLRIRQDGEVKQNHKAQFTAENADEVPRSAWLFIITCMLVD